MIPCATTMSKQLIGLLERAVIEIERGSA